jgi:hypothetical protein
VGKRRGKTKGRQDVGNFLLALLKATFRNWYLPFWNPDTNHNVNQHNLDFMTCGI